jgi:hypothetical protein
MKKINLSVDAIQYNGPASIPYSEEKEGERIWLTDARPGGGWYLNEQFEDCYIKWQRTGYECDNDEYGNVLMFPVLFGIHQIPHEDIHGKFVSPGDWIVRYPGGDFSVIPGGWMEDGPSRWNVQLIDEPDLKIDVDKIKPVGLTGRIINLNNYVEILPKQEHRDD